MLYAVDGIELLEMVKPARRISPQMPVVTVFTLYLSEYTKLRPVIYDARPDMRRKAYLKCIKPFVNGGFKLNREDITGFLGVARPNK